MSDQPLRVIFILGSGRSGSTLLAQMLAQSPDATTGGEGFWLPRRLSQGAATMCGCGELLGDCEQAAAVVAMAPSAFDVDDEAFEDAWRLSRLPGAIWRSRRRHGPPDPAGIAHAAICRAMASLDDVATVVDSSKRPAVALGLSSVPGIELEVIHLVRDPRSVVASWAQPKVDPVLVEDTLERRSIRWAIESWLVGVVAAETVVRWRVGRTRFHRLRYEDLVDDPREVLEGLFGRLDLAMPTGLFVDDSTVRLEPTHIHIGNPARHEGPVRRIERLDAWPVDLSTRRRRVVEAACWPIMVAMGYPFGRPRPRRIRRSR